MGELVLNIDELARLAYSAGFRGEGLVSALSVALAESGGDPHATGRNPGSIDRGIFQINSVYHAEVSDACAYDAACNARAAYTISSGGTNWGPWSTWHNGAAARHRAEAQVAVTRLTGTAGSDHKSLSVILLLGAAVVVALSL